MKMVSCCEILAFLFSNGGKKIMGFSGNCRICQVQLKAIIFSAFNLSVQFLSLLERWLESEQLDEKQQSPPYYKGNFDLICI